MTHRGPFQPLPFCDSVKRCLVWIVESAGKVSPVAFQGKLVSLLLGVCGRLGRRRQREEGQTERAVSPTGACCLVVPRSPCVSRHSPAAPLSTRDPAAGARTEARLGILRGRAFRGDSASAPLIAEGAAGSALSQGLRHSQEHREDQHSARETKQGSFFPLRSAFSLSVL